MQQPLSIYTVDQLYANVDVQGQIEKKLPSSAQPLAAPGRGGDQAARHERRRAGACLASGSGPRLRPRSAGRTQQFVSLIEDKGEYVSTTGGEVTLEYGSVVADLAARLGVDPATISEIQGVVQEYSTDLRQGLTTAQTQIKSVRATLSQVQAGELTPELQAESPDAQPERRRAPGEDREPREEDQGRSRGRSPPSSRAGWPSSRAGCPTLDGRLTALEQQTAAVLKDPSQANVEALDASLASLETRVTTLLDRQAVQTPRRARPDGARVSSTGSRPSSARSATSASCCRCWRSCSTWAPSTWRRGGAGRR